MRVACYSRLEYPDERSKMEKHKHTVACPVCGGSISADNEAEMIKMVQDHAKKNHNMDLTAEKVREMEKAQAKAK